MADTRWYLLGFTSEWSADGERDMIAALTAPERRLLIAPYTSHGSSLPVLPSATASPVAPIAPTHPGPMAPIATAPAFPIPGVKVRLSKSGQTWLAWDTELGLQWMYNDHADMPRTWKYQDRTRGAWLSWADRPAIIASRAAATPPPALPAPATQRARKARTVTAPNGAKVVLPSQAKR